MSRWRGGRYDFEVPPRSSATFISRLSAPPSKPRPPYSGTPRATLTLELDGDDAVARFPDMEAFASLWAHAVTDGAVGVSPALAAEAPALLGCTLVIGDDRFPAQQLKRLDTGRTVVELLPSPALLTCLARHARERHAGRPVPQPEGVSREAARFETALDVQFSDVPHLAERYATDISRGGLFVRCEPQPALHRRMPVRLTLPSGQTIELPVQVVQRVTEGPEPGVGVRFLDSSQTVLHAIQTLIKRYETRRPKVLVIDDEAIWRSSITKLLERMEVDVVTARDGREGLARLTDQLFELDLVVLDLHMPHIDGRGLMERVRRHGNETGLRLFLFSAAGPEELRALTESGLADGVFSKLDSIEHLERRLAQELRRPAAAK